MKFAVARVAIESVCGARIHWYSGGLAWHRGPDVGQQHHTIDYIEIVVTDMAAAQAFYAQAFGWTFTEYGPDYAGINNNGREVGGFSREDTPRTAGPLVVLYSDDIDASEQSVRDAGGEISTPTFAFPGGRRFHFTDPTGNELAVWTRG